MTYLSIVGHILVNYGNSNLNIFQPSINYNRRRKILSKVNHVDSSNSLVTKFQKVLIICIVYKK